MGTRLGKSATGIRNTTVWNTLPEPYAAHLPQVRDVLRKIAGRLDIKNADERRPIPVWDRIKHKTTYRVQFDNEKLIADCTKAIANSAPIAKARAKIRKADLAIGQGGVIATEATMQLPVDKAAYAIALGYCLAPHFATMRSLVTTKAFVVIRTGNGDDAATVGDVLAGATVLKTGRAVCNPHYELGEGDRFLVLGDAGIRPVSNSVRLIAQAAEQCLSMFCTMSAGTPTTD